MTPDPTHNPNLILASSSPQRAQLMRTRGYDFKVVEPSLPEPETSDPDLTPDQQAEALSYFKASSVLRIVSSGLILAGDTVVAVENRTFGKPVDRKDARRILRKLTGTTHRVITGVTLLDAATGRRFIEHGTTTVTMRRLRGGELEAYLDSGAWRGKAGAYGIQDRADAFVERIDGSFSNVVGFPMELIARMLQAWGYPPPGTDEKPSRDR